RAPPRPPPFPYTTLFRSAERVRAAWSEAGREGEPRLVALRYFALGDGAREAADGYVHHYYAIAGDEVAGQIAASVVDVAVGCLADRKSTRLNSSHRTISY